MNVISRHSGGATIEFSDAELLMIRNALNEVLHEIEDWEFETRMGCSRELAQSLLKAVRAAYDRKPDED